MRRLQIAGSQEVLMASPEESRVNESKGVLLVGAECSWFSVPAKSARDVSKLFGLTNISEETASTAVKLMRDGALVLFADKSGHWVTLGGSTGLGSPSREEMKPIIVDLLRNLSDRFESAFFFANRPSVGLYSWMRADGGDATRIFIYSGEVLCNEGRLTEQETQLNWDDIREVDYLSMENFDEDEGWDDEPFPTESSVKVVASGWSYDPADEWRDGQDLVLVGYSQCLR